MSLATCFRTFEHAVIPAILLFVSLTGIHLSGPSPASAQLQSTPDTLSLPFLNAGTRYLWPTNASNYMSATFGETRAAHFHAAIDVGTWGQRGYRVYASRDGILSRIGISPRGYGNVIYLKHDDGSYSLYAHLQDFIPQIRSVVDEIRFKDYSADFDQNLEHLNMRFSRGDLIGFTGDTGIGPPHLHFELRTPSNNPFNPLLAGISVPDQVPPRFSSLAIEPLSPDASINGSKQITRVPIRGGGADFTFSAQRISGTVGLAVDVSDRADNMRNVYAVYELKLYVNDELYFHSKADSFAMGTTRMMFLDRVFPILREHRRGYQRLYVKDGNRLAFYQETNHDPRLRLTEGRHSIRIEAADFFGNRSTARGVLIVEPQPATKPPVIQKHHSLPQFTSGNSGLSSNLRSMHWDNNWFANPTTRQTYTVTKTPVGSFSETTSTTTTLSGNQAVILSEADIKKITVDESKMLFHRVTPGKTTTIRTPDQRMEVQFGPAAVYDTMSVTIAYRYEGDQVIMQIMPGHEPLRSSIRIRFLMNEMERETRNISMYSVGDNGLNGRLGYMPSRIVGGRIEARTSSFGTFTVATDTIPPVVSRPRVFRRNDGKWFATVRVEDERSGIDYRNAVFVVNGVRGIAEFDPFAGLLIYHHPDFNPPSSNTLKITVTDMAGNVTEARFDRVGR